MTTAAGLIAAAAVILTVRMKMAMLKVNGVKKMALSLCHDRVVDCGVS